MKSARIIPIVRLPRELNEFDYEVPAGMIHACLPGTFVVIPFRSKNIGGLVTDLLPTSSSPLKPITRVLPLRYNAWDAQKEFLWWFAKSYCISRATALRTILPSFPSSFVSKGVIRESKKKPVLRHEAIFQLPDHNDFRQKKTRATLVTPSSLQESYAWHIAHIRAVQKTKKSVLLFFPAIHDIELFEPYARTTWQNERVVVLHSDLTPTTLFSRWVSLFDGAPSCILATRTGIGVPIDTLGTIIIDSAERVEHNQYDMNPRYDVRTVVWQMQKYARASVVFSSHSPRLEEYASPLLTEMGSGSISCKEIVSDPISFAPTIINMRDELRARGHGYISEKLLEEIKQCLTSGKGAFLFLNRTGTSRMIACRDCSHLFSCTVCQNPMRAVGALLICDACNVKDPLPSRCPLCRSVRFHFIAPGTEKIASLLRSSLPDIDVMEITQNTIPKDMASALHTHEGRSQYMLSKKVIVGTSLLPLSYPECFNDIGLVAVLNSDPRASASDFRSEEYHWHALARSAFLARSMNAKLIFQTFNTEHQGFRFLLNNDYDSYARHALEERATHAWPPFTRLVRIRIPPFLSSRRRPGSSPQELQEINDIAKECIRIGATLRSKTSHSILLSIPAPSRPDNALPSDLYTYLVSLPNEWLIDIDPLFM